MVKHIVITYILSKNSVSLQAALYTCHKSNNITALLCAFYNLETFRFLVLPLPSTVKYRNRSYAVYTRAAYSRRIVNALSRGNSVFRQLTV